MVRVENGVPTVRGRGGVKLFVRGREPRWYRAGERVEVRV